MRQTRKTLKTHATVGVSLFLLLLSPAIAQIWIQQFPTGTPPAPRYLAGNAYDEVNDRLILFSGEDFTGLPRPTDVWVLTDATGVGGTPTWVELLPVGGPPLGREGGTVVYDPTSNRIIVHAGCSANCSPALGDTWVLTNANGLGGTPTWIQLPSAPVARSFHSAVYDSDNNRMIVFGGNTAFFGTNRNDVWVLTDANGLGSPTWVQLFPTGTPPPPREGASIVYDQATNRIIVFGGVQFPNCCTFTSFNDVWVLTNANGLGGMPQWIQLTPAGTPPTARAAHSLVYDSSTNRMTVFGGVFDGRPNPPTFFNDVWILTEANGAGGSPQWIQITPTGGPPLARAHPSTGFSTVSNRMVVAMGRNDDVSPPLFNDVWVLTNANGVIELSIDIKPGSFPNSINPKSTGTIPVAILSTAGFDAPSEVDKTSLTFGRTGDEASLAFCTKSAEDVNGDGLLDLVCHFHIQLTGFQAGDTEGILKGKTVGGVPIEGRDSVRIKK